MKKKAVLEIAKEIGKEVLITVLKETVKIAIDVINNKENRK